MILILNKEVSNERDLDAMYRGRKRVFADRLGWPLAVTRDGREIDEFDACDPLYIVSCDAKGIVKGSMRLMPTTGPTLLSGVFGEAFDEPVDIRSATVWEVTRFCVHPDATEVTPTRMNRATVELCQALAEVGLRVGLTHMIGIYDDRMTRVYNRIGWIPVRLATSLPDRADVLHVGLWEVSRGALIAMQARSGIVDPMLPDEAITATLRKAG